MHRNMLTSSTKGFHIVELITIIAVTAILAAILTPALAKYNTASQANACINQKERVWKGIMLYAEDHDWRLPPAMPNICNFGPNDPTWPFICRNYLKLNIESMGTWNKLRCITDREDPHGIWTEGSNYAWWWNWQMVASPGYNYCYMSPYNESGDAHPIAINAAADPGMTLMFAESKYPHNDSSQAYGYFIIEPPTGENLVSHWWFGGWNFCPEGLLGARHEGMVTTVWLDGHVTLETIETLSYNDLWDLL